jgi:hypothetical protein
MQPACIFPLPIGTVRTKLNPSCADTVDQATKFGFHIDLKTAGALAIAMTQNLAAIADGVIE